MKANASSNPAVKPFNTDNPVYCIAPGTDSKALSDLLERRFASLDAMLLAVCGESGDVFRETNSDQVQDDYMWACHSLAAEAKALFQQLTSAGAA